VHDGLAALWLDCLASTGMKPASASAFNTATVEMNVYEREVRSCAPMANAAGARSRSSSRLKALRKALLWLG